LKNRSAFHQHRQQQRQGLLAQERQSPDLARLWDWEGQNGIDYVREKLVDI
jgi:hypothetical protein